VVADGWLEFELQYREKRKSEVSVYIETGAGFAGISNKNYCTNCTMYMLIYVSLFLLVQNFINSTPPAITFFLGNAPNIIQISN